jgi:hypothetical protein
MLKQLVLTAAKPVLANAAQQPLPAVLQDLV